MKINPHMFRAYDIRGQVGPDLNPESAAAIGRALVTWLAGKEDGGPLVVGQDNRPSSTLLSDALVEGIRSAGADVVRIGLSTSPLLYAAVIDLESPGGVNVTGSHLPPDYNGFKMVRAGAVPLSADEIQEVRRLIESGSLREGAAGEVTNRDAARVYLDRIVGKTDITRPMKVVVDTGNGVAGTILPEVLRRIGCQVTELHCELDSTFPHHLPNPEDLTTLDHIGQAVRDQGAELGLATDGDGDRLGVLDARGKVVSSEELIILFARDYLARRPGAQVLVDIKISKKVLEDIRNHGGEPVLWKSGHSLIKRKMRDDGILLGGEVSGHLFLFEDYLPVDDAAWAACRLIEILSRSDQDLRGLLRGIPHYVSTPAMEVGVTDERKFGVVDRVAEYFGREHEVDRTDGARIDFGHGWALVRASNTSPNLILRFEAKEEGGLAEIREAVERVVQETLAGGSPRA